MTGVMKRAVFFLFGLLLILVCSISFSAERYAPKLPEGFGKQVESGWLPELCARSSPSEIDMPLTRMWAAPRAGDPLHILFIVSAGNQYEALALARSIGATCDIVPLWGSYAWRENTADPDTMNLLRYYLSAREYDVIAMNGAWLSALPDDAENAIKNLIEKDGVGFVYAMPGIFPRVPSMQGAVSPILDPLLPLELDRGGYRPVTRSAYSVMGHPLAAGAEFSAMKWVSDVDSKLTEGAVPVVLSGRDERVLAAVAERGRGRIMSYNRCYRETTYGSSYMFLPLPEDDNPRVSGAMDFWTAGKNTRWLRNFEYADQFYGWLGKMLLWAADAQPPVKLDAASVKENTASITLNSDENRKVLLCGIVRSPFDSVQMKFDLEQTVFPGIRSIEQELPVTGYLGGHMLDIFVKDLSGKILDWTSIQYKVTGHLRVEHEQDYKLYGAGDVISVPLTLESAVDSACAINAEVYDVAGRLLLKVDNTVIIQSGRPIKTSVDLPLKDTGITSRLANVRITVRTGGEIVELRDQLLIRQEQDKNSFHLGAYHGMDHAPQNYIKGQVLKDMGHDTIDAGYALPSRIWAAVETGFSPIALWTASWQWDAEIVRKNTEVVKKFSPIMWEMQDEPELQFTPAVESRFDSKAHNERFRKRMEDKYGSIDKLNLAWDTEYKSWEDIRRVLWHEVLDTNNWAAWFDSRRDLDTVLLDGFMKNAEIIRSEIPGAFCSINPRAVDTLAGTDFASFGRGLGSMSLYAFFCARAPMGYLEYGHQWVPDRLQSIIGYTWPSNPNFKRMMHETWVALRHGANIISWFSPECDETPPQGRFSYLQGDMKPNAKGEAIAKINRVLLSGPGDIAAATEPLREGILIYYPRTRIYTTTLAHMKRQLQSNPEADPASIRGLGPWREQLPCSFVPHLRSLGYQFEFGDEKDLTAERLKNTRALFLPDIVALGENEMRLIRDFVNKGGAVIAESGTARRDAEGRLYGETPDIFIEMFGVKRPNPESTPLSQRDTVEAVDAEVFARLADGPVYRKGRAFFIDTPVSKTYSETGLINRILSACGISPAYRLRNNYLEHDSNTPIVSLGVRRRGEIEYLFLVADGNRTDTNFVVELPGPKYVYDVLAGKFIGMISEISGQVNYGDVFLYALSSSPVSSFTANASKKNVRAGEKATVRFKLSVKEGKSGDRIIILEASNQRQGILPYIPRTLLLKDGEGELDIYFPLNGVSEKLIINATDISSGETCVVEFFSV